MPPETMTPEQFDATWDEVNSEREAGTPPGRSSEQAPALDAKAPAAPAPSAAPVASASAPAEDPYAGLSPAAKARLQRLETDFARSQNEWKSAQGRISGLQRELDVARQAAQQTAHKPSESQIAAAASSPEKWEQMKRDFPEWGDAIESMVDSRLTALKPQGPAFDMNEIDRRVQQATIAARRELVEEFVEERHPRWKQKVNTPEFGTWFEAQPPEVQQLSASPMSRDAIRLLDLYTQSQGGAAAPTPAAPAATPVTQERKQRLQNAATTKPGTTPPLKSVDEMSEDEIWDHEARQRAQRRDEQGRFTRF